MTPDTTLIFIDGENLAIRYKEMLAAGRVPRPDNIYIEDCFIWNQRILEEHLWKLKRLCYHTSVVGDDVLVRQVRQKIAATTFTCTIEPSADGNATQTGQIIPFVRKRSAKSKKESVCDIAIAVDVMRACYRDHAETIWLFSGDGDFVPLIHEIVHSGKRAYASAFSSGLNDELRYIVDEFLPLDDHLFLTPPEVAANAEKAQTAPVQQQAPGSNPAAT